MTTNLRKEADDLRERMHPHTSIADLMIAFAALREAAARADDFQSCVKPWMLACFGEKISSDTMERNHRFLEESLELVQSCGCTLGEAHQLVDYVYGRAVGEKSQEVGGVMVTLAALCLAQGLDMHECGEIELARIWTKVDQIRAKQAAKPAHSPLPSSPPSAATVSVPVEVLDFYHFASVTFQPFTSQQEEIKLSLDKARKAMIAASKAERK